MALVYRAQDERLKRMVALKVMAPWVADEEYRSRFIREFQAVAALDDPHVIPLFEADEADGLLFIAMRYVSGGDVRALLRQQGQLPAGRAMAIISPVAAALDSAHATGLVHRDVKPANMLLDARPGRPDHVYLSDFGISKTGGASETLTRAGQRLGTPAYSSPEQLRGQPVDGRTDQYALACTAFQLLSGELPFPQRHLELIPALAPPALTSRRPDLPAHADAVLRRALTESPGDRYPSCADFAEALRAALGLTSYRAAPARSRGHRTATAPASGAGATVSAAHPYPDATMTPPPATSAHRPVWPPPVDIRPGQATEPRRPPEIRTAPRPRVTPGDVIVECWDPDPGIYLRYQDGPVALLAPGGTMPDVSPSGDWISYVMNEREIWLMRPQGADRRQVAVISDDAFTVAAVPRWSPNGRHLAFELRRERGKQRGAESDIYLLEVATGEYRSLTGELQGVSGDAQGPVTWTPDGHLVFQKGDYQLYLLKGDDYVVIRHDRRKTPGAGVRRDAPFQPVIFSDPDALKVRSLTCAPNGRIVYVRNGSWAEGLAFRWFSRWRYDKTNAFDVFFSESGISCPRILPDNNTMVYASREGIFRVRLNRQLTSVIGRAAQRLGNPRPHDPEYLGDGYNPVPIVHAWP